MSRLEGRVVAMVTCRLRPAREQALRRQLREISNARHDRDRPGSEVTSSCWTRCDVPVRVCDMARRAPFAPPPATPPSSTWVRNQTREGAVFTVGVGALGGEVALHAGTGFEPITGTVANGFVLPTELEVRPQVALFKGWLGELLSLIFGDRQVCAAAVFSFERFFDRVDCLGQSREVASTSCVWKHDASRYEDSIRDPHSQWFYSVFPPSSLPPLSLLSPSSLPPYSPFHPCSLARREAGSRGQSTPSRSLAGARSRFHPHTRTLSHVQNTRRTL